MEFVERDNIWVVIDRLADVILDNVEGCIVEIGIGASTLVLAKHAEEMGVKLYGCDKRGRVRLWAMENIDYDGFIVYHGRSFDFMDEFEEDKVALVFLDGNHDYDVVSKEFYFFLDRLTPGGVIFVHDTYYHWDKKILRRIKYKGHDTYLFRQELEKRDDIWCLTWPYTAARAGLTMAMKKEKNRPFYRK